MALEAQEVAVRLRLLGGTAFQAEADRAAGSLKGVGAAADEVNASAAAGGGLTGFLGGASKSLDTVTGKLDKFSKKSLQVGRETAVASAASAALIYFSTKEYIESEKQFKLLETQAHATKKLRQELEGTVPSFAKFGVGPKELAEAYYPAQSVFHNFKADVGSVQAASEGMAIGLDTLPNTISAVTAAFKTGFKDVHGYKEEMALLDETVGAGRMHLPELTAAFKGSLFPTASSLGIPQRDILANLAAATQTGQEPEEYSTRFRTALTKMIGLKGEALADAKKLGFGKNQMAEEMRKPGGLNLILRQLAADQHGPLGEIEANRDISAVFGGSRSAGTIFTALKTLKANEEILKRLTGVQGGSTLDTHFKQTEETTAFQLKVTKTALKDLSYEMGKFFAPFVLKGLHDVTEAAKGFVTVFKSLPTPLKDAVGGFIALVAVMSPLAFLLAGGAAGLRLLLWPMKLLIGETAALAGEEGFSGLETAVYRLRYGLGGAIGPMLGLTAAIGALYLLTIEHGKHPFNAWEEAFTSVFGGHTAAEKERAAAQKHERSAFLHSPRHLAEERHREAVLHRPHPWSRHIKDPKLRHEVEGLEAGARSGSSAAEKIAQKIELHIKNDISLDGQKIGENKRVVNAIERKQREHQNRR